MATSPSGLADRLQSPPDPFALHRQRLCLVDNEETGLTADTGSHRGQLSWRKALDHGSCGRGELLVRSLGLYGRGRGKRLRRENGAV